MQHRLSSCIPGMHKPPVNKIYFEINARTCAAAANAAGNAAAECDPASAAGYRARRVAARVEAVTLEATARSGRRNDQEILEKTTSSLVQGPRDSNGLRRCVAPSMSGCVSGNVEPFGRPRAAAPTNR